MNNADMAYRWQWRHDGQTQVPPFGGVSITGWESDDQKGLILLGKEPSGDSEDLTCANGPVEVAANGLGAVHVPNLCWVVLKNGEATSHGDELGIDSGTAEFIKKGGGGYKQIGDRDTDGSLDRALVYRPGGGGDIARPANILDGQIIPSVSNVGLDAIPGSGQATPLFPTTPGPHWSGTAGPQTYLNFFAVDLQPSAGKNIRILTVGNVIVNADCLEFS